MAPKRRRVSTALPGQGKKAKKMMEDDSDEDDEASILSGIADTAGAAPQVIGADDSSLQKLYGRELGIFTAKAAKWIAV